MKVTVVQYEPETITEDDVEEMKEFDAACFDPSQYHTYIVPKECEEFASCIASLTEKGLKYKLFKEEDEEEKMLKHLNLEPGEWMEVHLNIPLKSSTDEEKQND